MSEPGPSTSARTGAVTPPRTPSHNANLELTPERVRQVELNRLRGIIPPIHMCNRVCCSLIDTHFPSSQGEATREGNVHRRIFRAQRQPEKTSFRRSRRLWLSDCALKKCW